VRRDLKQRLGAFSEPVVGRHLQLETVPHTDQQIERLTRAIRAGDTDAFAVLYDATFDLMLAQARRCTGRDEAFCLDVVQDACMRIIKSIRPLPSRRALERWLGVVVRSCAYDRLRSECRRRRRELKHPVHKLHDESMIEQNEDREQLLIWLGAQMRALPDADLRLLSWRYRMGWTLERIGRVLRISPGAVDGRLARLLRQFRRGLP